MEKTPPILHSDIILIELINPETNVEEEVTNLADPVVVTVPTRVADLTSFDLVVSFILQPCINTAMSRTTNIFIHYPLS